MMVDENGDTAFDRWMMRHQNMIQYAIIALNAFFIGMYVRGLVR